MTPSRSEFGARFLRQKERIDTVRTHGSALVAVAAAVLVALAVILRPPLLVFGVVFILLFMFSVAFQHWLAVLDDSAALAGDLDEVVKDVRDGRTLEELLASDSLQDDRFRPLTQSLAATPPNRADLVLAARELLEPLNARLDEAASYRPLLVLGGLFGTVLFFAVELGRPAVATGAIAELLPGLQGALLSTLAGLLSSALLGYCVGQADRERSLLEADLLGFARGPLWSRAEVESTNLERDGNESFWNHAALELKRLREDTSSTYLSVANEVRGYATALEQIHQRLSAIPAVKVPKELAHLSGVAKGFEEGMKAMNEGVRVLVAAVDIASTDLPERIVKRVEAIQEEQGLQRKSLVSLDRTLAELSERLKGIDLEGVPPHLAELTGQVRSDRQVIEAIHGAMKNQVGLVDRLTAQTDLLNAARTSLEGTRASLEGTRDQLNDATAEVSVSSRLLNDVATSVRTNGGVIESAAAGLEGTHRSVEAMSGKLDTIAGLQREIRGSVAQQSTLERIESKLSEASAAARRNDRGPRSLLMRVLDPIVPERFRRGRNGKES